MITPCKLLLGNLDNNELITVYKMILWTLRHCENTQVVKTNQKAMKDIMLVMDARHIKVFEDEVVIMEPLPNYGDHMEINEWKECCRHNNFIDYDGSGVFATDKLTSSIPVVPSDVTRGAKTFPKWATHVVWFNR